MRFDVGLRRQDAEAVGPLFSHVLTGDATDVPKTSSSPRWSPTDEHAGEHSQILDGPEDVSDGGVLAEVEGQDRLDLRTVPVDSVAQLALDLRDVIQTQ